MSKRKGRKGPAARDKRRHRFIDRQDEPRTRARRPPKVSPLIPQGPSPLDARAKELGHADYHAYTKSAHWVLLKMRFLAKWPGAKCLGCGDPKFQLHHTLYDRLGAEQLTDFIPLCRVCHERMHAVCRANKLKLTEYPLGLSIMFGWSPGETAKRLESYRANIY